MDSREWPVRRAIWTMFRVFRSDLTSYLSSGSCRTSNGLVLTVMTRLLVFARPWAHPTRPVGVDPVHDGLALEREQRLGASPHGASHWSRVPVTALTRAMLDRSCRTARASMPAAVSLSGLASLSSGNIRFSLLRLVPPVVMRPGVRVRRLRLALAVVGLGRLALGRGIRFRFRRRGRGLPLRRRRGGSRA